MGSFANQQSPGRYIDGFLYQNLEVMANAIKRDMTFMGIIFSSTLEVGTGKSVLATQVGEAWTDIMNTKHGKDLPFTSRNVVWRPKDLIDVAFKVPKYSCLLLDEWEDAGYWSALGMSLRQFFRKCRQLNLFILCIIPNWFQLPLGYAVSRSAFAIDVRFGENFSRGTYAFYNFQAKRQLYIKGKKFYDYNVARPTFMGSFTDGYGVPEQEYRAAKLLDMQKYDEEDDNGKKPTMAEIETNIRADTIQKLRNKLDLTNKKIADAMGVSEMTVSRWFNRGKVRKDEHVVPLTYTKHNTTESYMKNKEGEGIVPEAPIRLTE